MQRTDENHITTFLLTITFLILLLSLFILTILYLYRKKQIDYQHNIQKIQSTFEKNLLTTQLEIQEQTLENIAKDIHDNISLSLTLAKLHLLTLDFEDLTRSKKMMGSSIDLITKALIDLTDISKSMNPSVIQQIGLIDALKIEVDRIRKINLFDIEMCVRGSPQFLNSKTELLIYRIIQESLNNVIKHATATRVIVDLFYDHEYIVFKVADNGKGFNPEMPINRYGSGLHNMKSRAKELNGSFQIESGIQLGTKIIISIPICKIHD